MASPVIPQPLFVPGGNQRSFSEQLILALTSQVPNLAMAMARELRTRNQEQQLESDRLAQEEAAMAMMIPTLANAYQIGGPVGQIAGSIMQQHGMSMGPLTGREGGAVAPSMTPMPTQMQMPASPGLAAGPPVSAPTPQPAMRTNAAAGATFNTGTMTPGVARAMLPTLTQQLAQTQAMQAQRAAEIRAEKGLELEVARDKRDERRLDMENTRMEWAREAERHAKIMREADLEMLPHKKQAAINEAIKSRLDNIKTVDSMALDAWSLMYDMQNRYMASVYGPILTGGGQAAMDAFARSGMLYLQGRTYDEYIQMYRNYMLEGNVSKEEFAKWQRIDPVIVAANVVEMHPDTAYEITKQLNAWEEGSSVEDPYKKYNRLVEELNTEVINGALPKEIWADQVMDLNHVFNAWLMDAAERHGTPYVPLQLGVPTKPKTQSDGTKLNMPDVKMLKEAMGVATDSWLAKVLAPIGAVGTPALPGSAPPPGPALPPEVPQQVNSTLFGGPQLGGTAAERARTIFQGRPPGAGR